MESTCTSATESLAQTDILIPRAAYFEAWDTKGYDLCQGGQGWPRFLL